MGELEKIEAEALRRAYQGTLEQIKAKVQMNYKDMDFNNANKREDIKEIVGDIKGECDKALQALADLSFYE